MTVFLLGTTGDLHKRPFKAHSGHLFDQTFQFHNNP